MSSLVESGTSNSASDTLTAPTISNKDAFKKLFKDLGEVMVKGQAKFGYKCFCGHTVHSTKNVLQAGYQNVISHLNSTHPDWRQRFRKDHPDIRGYMKKSAPRKDVVQVAGWLDFVVTEFQPFNVVENPTFIKHVKFEGMSTRTLRDKMIHLQNKLVEVMTAEFSGLDARIWFLSKLIVAIYCIVPLSQLLP